MNTPRSWTIRDYFQAAGRFKGRAMAFFALTMLLAMLYLLFVPRRYESESKLFVRVGRENAALDPTLTKGETMAVSASREEEMNSIVEHLRSRYILERTLARLDPQAAEADPVTREKALIALGNALSVTSPRATTVVTVQGRAGSPEQAQKIVATMVEVYLEEHMRTCRLPASYAFFSEQCKHLDEQLETAQGALRDAKNKIGIASIEGRRTALEGQINAVETKIHEVGTALAAAEAKTKALNAAIQSLPAPLLKQMVGGVPNDGLAAMRDRLFQLQMHEDEVRSKLSRSHPVAAAVHEEVQEVTGVLSREEPERPYLITAISAQDTANQASLAAEKQCLLSQLGLLQKSLATLNSDEVRIDKLARNVLQIQTQYLAYAENKEAARMDQALRIERISNVSIIQPATLVALPVSPRKALTLFLAMLGGALGGVVVVLLSEQWDQGAAAGPARSRLRQAARADLDPLPARV